MKTINNYIDIGYSVVMERIENRCEFKIYAISHTDHYDDDDDGHEIELFYETKDSEHTTKVEEAVIFIKGTVKWDGCSNWEVDNDNVMIHCCNRQHLVNVGEIMARCYDIANDAGFIS